MIRASHFLMFLFLSVFLSFFFGCGGGGGGGETTPQALSGTFVDAPVQGLSYQTATQSGVTDSLGTFQYLAGESVSFSLGSINLGQATAKTLMTPIDLVTGATDAENSNVINIVRFLQTLDDDATPANGIDIPEAIRTAAVSMSVDFDVCVTAFEYSTANIQIFQSLTLLTSAGQRELCDVDGALEHFEEVVGETIDLNDVDLDGDGYSVNRGDCDDTDADVNLDAVEICNDEIDNDCDGTVDQNCTTCTDVDGDGYYLDGGDCGTVDCDDADAAVNPDATEDCEDGVDNDCDGTIDQGCLTCTDGDGDGFYLEGGDCGTATDCNDTDSSINPGATEICEDSIDQDCNGSDLTCPSQGDATTDPPASPVKLIFIHHSTGGNWLADSTNDPSGGLGTALMNNNYYVSATNYGWGPDSIGDNTDLIYWIDWFTGANSSTYLAALYTEYAQNVEGFGDWTRLSSDPGGENTIIMFKSCFPNSDLYGNATDAAQPSPDPSSWGSYTVANAKAVYNNILDYFATKQDKLFVVITAPPLIPSETTADHAANARAFNNWLMTDWLAGYQYNNVAVFDYYNVLTDPDNHHRWHNGVVQHVNTNGDNYSYYPDGDSHPCTCGHTKATEEFVPLLNYWYNLWQQD